MKKSVLVDHEKTRAHKQATIVQKENDGVSAAVSKCHDTNVDKGLVNIFRVLLFLAQQDIAIAKFDQMCSLIQECGGDMINIINYTETGIQVVKYSSV